MGRKIKKSVAVVLVATFLMSMFIIAPSAAETGNNESVVNNNDYSLEGNNSVGNLIADEIADHQSKQISSDGEYLITELEVNKNIATVSYTAKDNCTILVAIYDENNGTMIASGKTEVSADESEADVKIETENMPEYFVAKAFILNESNAPLSKPYCSEMYTTEIQKLKKLTVNDFEPEEVLNFDDDNITNFGVYSDDVKKVVSNESANTIQSANDDTFTYVFANADESLTSLQKGDIFVCNENTENPVIIKVGRIDIDGTNATVVGDETSLDEVFEYVKIESNNDIKDAEIDKSTMSEGVTYKGFTENDDSSVSRRRLSSRAIVDTEVQAKQKVEFDFVTGKKVEDDDEPGFSGGFSGTVGLYAEASLEIYVSWSRQVFNFRLTIETAYEVSASASYTSEIDFAEFKIPISGNFVSLVFTPGAYFEAEAALSLKFGIDTVVGFGYTDEDGFSNLSQKPHATDDCGINLEGTLEFGLKLDISVVVGKKWIGEAGLTGKVGLEFTAGETEKSEIKGVTVEHSCKMCYSGEINFVISIEPFVKILKEDVLDDLFDTELEIVICPNADPLATWYYSADHKKGGLGACPYMDYKIPIKVVKNGTPMANTYVMEYQSLNKSLGQTDVDGCLEMCLPGTETGLYLISVDNAHVSFAIKDDDVQVLENGKWYSISKAENFKDGVYVIDVPLDPPPTEPEPTEPETTEPVQTEPITKDPSSEIIDSGNYGNSINWKLLGDGTLKIDGYSAIPDSDYSGSYIPWREYRNKITKVIISNGVTRIGDYVFRNFTSLKDIIIPESVISIGKYAFTGCSSLININLPYEMKVIGAYAFSECSELETVNIPNSVTSIREGIFLGCSSLRNIDIPSSVKSIGSGAFYECSSLMDINIPNGITSIEASTFYGCSSLKKVDVPESVTSIGYSAFACCTNLIYVNIPEGVENINYHTFAWCSSLKEINIPNSVTSIGEEAFWGCTNLTNITIPDSVNGIGATAFNRCSSLPSIYIPENVTSIGTHAFAECASLERIDVSENNQYYSSANGLLFNYDKTELISCPANSKITSYKIPDGVTQIDSEAFYGCTNLEKITIPDSIIKIDFYAFNDCTNLKKIYFEGNAPQTFGTGINDICFKNVTATAYYPFDNTTWVRVKLKNYGGDITWVPYDPNVPIIASTSKKLKSISLSSSQNTVKDTGISTVTAEYDNKVKNTDYIIAVVKDPNANDILSADNLLYIDQFASDNDGKISVLLPVSSDVKDYEIVLFGPEKTNKKGDVDGDGEVTVDDATAIQKYAVEFLEFDSEQIAAADVDGDGKVSIGDVTIIQKYIADIITSLG